MKIGSVIVSHAFDDDIINLLSQEKHGKHLYAEDVRSQLSYFSLTFPHTFNYITQHMQIFIIQ